MARSLETHPKVARVHYPGLESHPGHSIAAELFDGFGGMLSFELEGGAESAERFMQSVELPIDTVSLGGVETLITRPAITTHSAMPATDLERLGISEGLMRLSVGIESEAELLADVGQALDRTFS